MRDGEKKRMWLTKYALTEGGPREMEMEIVYSGSRVYAKKDMIFVSVGKDAFETKEAARANVIEKAKAAIKSAEKKKAKLELLIRQMEA